MQIYDQPRYYDMSVDKSGVKRQVDYFEAVAKRYGRPHTSSFLDMACGTSPQLLELARRGYHCTGLDRSAAMLEYLSNRALGLGLRMNTVRADMLDFRLGRRHDFAFILSDSLDTTSNGQLLRHLRSVGGALRRGGIYLIDEMAMGPTSGRPREVYKSGSTTVIYYSIENTVVDELRQLYMTDMNMIVKENGKSTRYRTRYPFKVFYPQELRSLAELEGSFEFLGWFEHLGFRPLLRAKHSNTVLLRKR